MLRRLVKRRNRGGIIQSVVARVAVGIHSGSRKRGFFGRGYGIEHRPPGGPDPPLTTPALGA